MTRLGRSLAAVGSALAIAVASGCGTAGRVEAKQAVSPCGKATAPAWSPDGKQIAWYGFRWPLPPHHHAVGSYNVLRAICISDANGKHLHRLRHTTCSEHCPDAFSDPPDRLAWVAPMLLLSGSDQGIYTVRLGRKPKLLGKTGPIPFSTDAGGDRVAAGAAPASCLHCSGPVRILAVPSGAVVGAVGGTKLENTEPRQSFANTRASRSSTRTDMGMAISRPATGR